MSSKKDIKVRVVDWWCKDTEANFYDNFLIKILQKKYNVIYSDQPDYVIFGPFGLEHMRYKNAIKIFLTGEVKMSDWHIADYGIDYDYMCFNDRHLRYPFSFWQEQRYVLAREKHTDEFIKKHPKTKFCSTMVSVPTKDAPRDDFFYKLCEYKKVDSGGRHLNNVGGGYIADKLGWIKDYKFNLCIENASSVGYFTEKMMDAWAAGCIPIYWGDLSVKNPALVADELKEYKINTNSFINIQNYNSFDEAIEEIKRIDNDDEAYMAMLKEPAFLDDVNWYEYYQKRLESFLFNIFEQKYQDAKRVPQTHYIRRYRRNHFHIINVGYLQFALKNLKKKLSFKK